MIAYIKGVLIRKQQNEIVVETGGIGYSIGISTQTLSQLPGAGDTVKLEIYHHFSESDQRLFGFLDLQEKRLFELLLTVKSIGPKLALGILSGMSSKQIVESITRGDVAGLSRIPGIGRKTAERMVLELKDRLSNGLSSELVSGGTLALSLIDEAVAALIALGYKKTEAERSVLQVLRGDDAPETPSEVIKMALKGIRN